MNVGIQHNADGNLLSVDNGATAVYVYDALNRRVRVQTASSTDEYIYDYANRRISTWLPNGAGIEGRIYWGSLLTAFRAQNGDTYFDQKDILGTDRLRMNYAAVAAANYASLPFGDGYTANVSGAYGDQDNNHFAQLDRDAETDTDHAQFRQYYNTWGRWMSPDPYSGSYDITNPQSFNRYSYVMNNALAFVDPIGLYLYVPGGGTYCNTMTVEGTTISTSDSFGDSSSTSTPSSTVMVCVGGSTGDGGGGGGRGIGPAPINPPDRLHCAANFANQFSVAGITGLNNYHGIGSSFLNAALGNTFSGLVDAADAWKGTNGKSGLDLYGMGLAGGPLMGIPLPAGAPPGLVGPLGTAINPAIDAATASSATTIFAETAIGEGMAGPVALAKGLIDLGTFAAGYAVCHP